jgi:hypothetical protein
VSWKKFLLSINSIGILLLWLGPPLIYFIKSLIMPNAGSLFTGVFYILGIILMVNSINAKIGFIPNIQLLLFGGIFFVISQCYLFFYNFEPQNFSADILNLFLITLYFFYLLKTENGIKYILPFWIFLFTLIINLCLIYSISNNPLYTLGARATVQFGTDEFTGNPYIYARNGFAGFIISYLIIKFRSNSNALESNFFTQFFCYFNLWLSLVVIFLTQTRTIFLSFLIILIPLFFFIRGPKQELNKPLFSYPLLLFYSLFSILVIYFNNVYNIFDFITNSFTHTIEIFTNAIDTGINMGSNVQDESAMGRVGGIKIMLSKISERPEFLISGGGYRFLYMDIPFLEALINFGIFTFFFFVVFQLYIFKHAIYAIFSKDILQVFLGFMSFQILIAIFTTGRCLDFSYWISYFVLIRFFENDFSIFKFKTS